MKILVASKNPVKVNAVQEAFKMCFTNPVDVAGLSVKSDVPDQPMSDGETRTGAKNRVTNLMRADLKADFYVGIEGGVDLVDARMQAFAWIAISNGDKLALGRTGSFELPPEIAQLVIQGLELGDADDQVFKASNSKQQNGAVGLLTHDLITRQQLYQHAIMLALIPFLNTELYD